MTLLRELAPYASGFLAGLGLLYYAISQLSLAQQVEGWPESRLSTGALRRSLRIAWFGQFGAFGGLAIGIAIRIGDTPIVLMGCLFALGVLNIVGHYGVLLLERRFAEEPRDGR